MRPIGVVLSALALGLLAFAGDLTGAEDNFVREELTGVVHIPLTARGPDGKIFRLRDATFEITGAAMFTVSDRDANDASAGFLTATLPAGLYSIYLRPGFELVEYSAKGAEQRTAATLLSKNPMGFEIGRTLNTRVQLTLRSGEHDVVFGARVPLEVTSADVAGATAL